MTIRRSGTCDQRRRRVLLEENLAAPPSEAESGTRRRGEDQDPARPQTQRSYTDAALACHQPPVTALIPQRFWTLAVLALAGLSAIAGIVAVHGQIFQRTPAAVFGPWRCLDLQAPGSLAGWFSSLVLLAACFLSVQILRLRRHKTDDYRGRYRVWFWLPALFFMMAAAAVTKFHVDVFIALQNYTDWLNADQWQWTILGTVCGLWTLAAIRLGIEVRSSRGALFLLTIATACYYAAASKGLISLPEIGQILLVMAESSALMLGHLATLLTVAVYARYVYDDAQGKVCRKPRERRRPSPVPSAEPTAVEQAEADESSPSVAEQDVPEPEVLPMESTAPAEPRQREVPEIRAAKPAPSPQEKREDEPRRKAAPEPELADDDDEMDEISDAQADNQSERKLSKAERRRLRKQQRRDRQAA